MGDTIETIAVAVVIAPIALAVVALSIFACFMIVAALVAEIACLFR